MTHVSQYGWPLLALSTYRNLLGVATAKLNGHAASTEFPTTVNGSSIGALAGQPAR